jgi:hypothetical protein
MTPWWWSVLTRATRHNIPEDNMLQYSSAVCLQIGKQQYLRITFHCSFSSKNEVHFASLVEGGIVMDKVSQVHSTVTMLVHMMIWSRERPIQPHTSRHFWRHAFSSELANGKNAGLWCNVANCRLQYLSVTNYMDYRASWRSPKEFSFSYGTRVQNGPPTNSFLLHLNLINMLTLHQRLGFAFGLLGAYDYNFVRSCNLRQATCWDQNKTNSVVLSPRANYTEWATATCRRNLMPTSVDRGMSRGQRGGSPTVVNLSFLDRRRYFSFK